jgi:hypothetical protein
VADEPADFAIVAADEVRDAYAGTDVPGEFHSLTEALRATQIAATLIRIPPHYDFEQGTGHTHDEIEELYLIARGELTISRIWPSERVLEQSYCAMTNLFRSLTRRMRTGTFVR